jgi:hypothetical protein
MEKIQEISEKLLLALYVLYRKNGDISGDESVSFENLNGWEVQSDNDELLEMMLKVSNGSVLNLKNSLKYLYEKDLINFSQSGLLSGSFALYDMEITSRGIDLIEGVTGPETSRVIYQNTFNVKLADNINLDSLIAVKLGAEFKLF